MPRPPALLLLLTALLLSTAACQTPDSTTPTATVPSTPSPTATPTEPTTPATDSYEVPDVIDEAYAERVLQALYRVESEALRIAMENDAVVEEASQRLEAIYDRSQSEAQIEILDVAADQGFPGLRRPPGDVTFDVEAVVSGSGDCVLAVGLRDFSATVVDPVDRTDERDYVQLLTIQPGQDPEHLNPTPWVIGGVVVANTQNPPENPCLDQ